MDAERYADPKDGRDDMYGFAHEELANTMPQGTREKDAKIPVMDKAVTGYMKTMREAREAGDEVQGRRGGVDAPPDPFPPGDEAVNVIAVCVHEHAL